jgi:hypothetical protein
MPSRLARTPGIGARVSVMHRIWRWVVVPANVVLWCGGLACRLLIPDRTPNWLEPALLLVSGVSIAGYYKFRDGAPRVVSPHDS